MDIEQLYEIYLRHPSVQTDTRLLRDGDIFFALKGPSFNGNQFALRALELGAAYAVIDEAPGSPADGSAPAPGPLTNGPGSGSDSRLLFVPDVLTTLQGLALHHRRQFDIPFIAITGSNGKTTTKELIHSVLSTTYKTYTTRGNLNNHIGIPLTILSVRPDAQLAVIEMGANHQKEIESYCRYTLPTHGLITNVGKAHLEGFGGPEGVRRGKGELYDYLRTAANGTGSPAVPAGTGSPTVPAYPAAPAYPPPPGSPAVVPGTAFVMWDYDYLREMSVGIPHIIKYGTHDADFTGQIRPPGGWISYPPLEPGQPMPQFPPPDPNEPPPTRAPHAYLTVQMTKGADIPLLATQLVGDYNLPNVLSAVAVGKHFGIPDKKIKDAILDYEPTNGRSQTFEWEGNHVIMDAYNANPSSMRAAIENFAAGRPGKNFLILGAMAELGPESLAEHQAIVDLIRQYPWEDVVLVGGDFLKFPHGYRSFRDSREAGEWLRQARLKDAILLIKGSRSMKMEEVLNDQPSKI